MAVANQLDHLISVRIVIIWFTRAKKFGPEIINLFVTGQQFGPQQPNSQAAGSYDLGKQAFYETDLLKLLSLSRKLIIHL